MKRLLAISLFLLTAVRLDAQWLNSDVYDRPLKEVLQQVEEQYGIKLLYEDKNVKGRIVKSARGVSTTMPRPRSTTSCAR